MKPFKFLRLNEFTLDEEWYINAPYIPLLVTEPRGINACIMQGYRANRDNLPPGQCPYDIGTQEREHWMTGWSSRENREPPPYERF